MTTLSKDEILRLAREAGMPVTDYGSGQFIDDGVTTMHIEKLYTLCRADLVAENASLRQELWSATERNTNAYKALGIAQAEINALNADAGLLRNLVKAIKIDRHDVEDWPADSRAAYLSAMKRGEV